MKDNQASVQRNFFIAVVFLFALGAIVIDSPKTTFASTGSERMDGDVVYAIYEPADPVNTDYVSEEERFRSIQQELLQRALNLFDGVDHAEVIIDGNTVLIELTVSSYSDAESVAEAIKDYAQKYTKNEYYEANISVVLNNESSD